MFIKRNLLGFILVTILFGIVITNILGEKTRNDGAGWDGVLYREMSEHFFETAFNQGYSSYYMKKCLPFALTCGIRTGISALGVAPPSSIGIISLLQIIALLLSIIAFFKISRYLNFNKITETITFSLLFFTHTILKGIGYSPFLGDQFALCISMWLFYFFIMKKYLFMMIIAVTGAFTWQSIWPISLVLLALPHSGITFNSSMNHSKSENKAAKILLACCMLMPFAFLGYLLRFTLKKTNDILSFYNYVPYFFESSNMFLLAISTILLCIYIYFVFRPFCYNTPNIVRAIFSKSNIATIFIAIILLFALDLVIKAISIPEDTTNSFINFSFIRRLMWEPLMLPLKFLECHFVYYGLSIVFLIAFYNDIIKYASYHSIGYLFALAFVVVFGTQTESRFILNMLPFVVFAIGLTINNYSLSKVFTVIIVSGQLLISRFWVKLNTPGVIESWKTENDETYLLDSAQRAFSYSGPWQNSRYYCMYMACFVIVLILFILYQRKYLKEQNNICQPQ